MGFHGFLVVSQDGVDQARLYSVDPVISAFDFQEGTPSRQYAGTTLDFSAIDPVFYGGPSSYFFGPLFDDGDLSVLGDQVILSSFNVGEQTYRFPTTYVSDQGQVYDVRSFEFPIIITPAPLEVIVEDTSKAYGTQLDLSGVNYTANTLFPGDSITGGIVISEGAAADVPVSDNAYFLGLSGLTGSGLSNYSISIVPGSLRVVPRAVDVEIDDAQKTYGEEIVFDGTEFTVTGLLGEDTLSSLTIKSDGQPAEAPVTDSPYLIDGDDPVGTGLENYNIRIFPGELTLTPAPLTITADDQSKPFGTEFVFTGTEFTVTGLLNEDSVDSANLTSDGAAPGVPLGGEGFVIVITDPEGEGLDNYEITLVNGIMIIGPGNLTITANDQSKLYGTELTFDGTEFTVAGLAEGDSVDSVTLNSDGTPVTAQVADGPFAIIPSDPVGTGLEKYTLIFADGSLTVIQAPLTVTANDQLKQEGQTFTFAGTEFTVTGLLNGDTVDSAVLTSDGAAAEASVDDSPFDILIGELTGTGVDNYDVTRVNGVFTVDNIVVPPTVNPMPPWSSTLPNPTDRLTLSLFTSQNRADPVQGNVQGFDGPQQSLGDARTTLALVDSLSSDLELAVRSCGSADQDFTNYMACLSESLDTYANALDEIVNDLPPGLENVAATIRTARDGVNAAAARAQRRLAGATSASERRAIRRDALTEARGAINQAQDEIRKAITLIRADDPEVAAVQRNTGARIIQAFDTVDSELARAVEL
ncbi:MBG domain-containing protein [Sulfitobacter sediminilitoris]|uniref:MBG domain-containing protein n=1 Tax=Sulfitobacter sediminilitoris TaxID=2698830 RepID=UPI0036081CC5